MKLEKLGDLVTITSGGTPLTSVSEYHSNGTIPWVRTGDLKVRHLVDIPEKISETGLKNSSAKIFPVNTVLVAMYGATIGACSILKVEAATNQACAALLPSEKINHEFLYFYLTFIKKDLIRRGVGGGQPNISATILKSLKIPLPSLEDQDRIAYILSKAEKLIQQRKESIALLDALLKSIFLEMFGDPVKNEKGWEKSPLKNYSKVRIGPFGSLLHQGDYISEGIPLVNPTHIKDGKIEPDFKLTISKSKIKELSAYIMQEGDLVLGRRGEIGRCAIVTKKEDGFLCGTGSIFIRPATELHPTYLYNVISSSPIRKVLENLAKGVTMMNLNSGIVEDLKIPIPPPKLQNQFAQIVEKAEALKEQFQSSLKELENLYGSISQRAFKGELDLSMLTEEYFQTVQKDVEGMKPPKFYHYSFLIKTESDSKELKELVAAGILPDSFCDPNDEDDEKILVENAKKGNSMARKILLYEIEAVLFQRFSNFYDEFEYNTKDLKPYLLSKNEILELIRASLDLGIRNYRRKPEQEILVEWVWDNSNYEAILLQIDKLKSITPSHIKKYVVPAIKKVDESEHNEKIFLISFGYNLHRDESKLLSFSPLLVIDNSNSSEKKAAEEIGMPTQKFRVLKNAIEGLLLFFAKKTIQLKLLTAKKSKLLQWIVSNHPANIVDTSEKSSLWLQISGLGKSSGITFTNAEGNAVLQKVFSKQKHGFSFQEFEAFVKKEKFKYTYAGLKDFFFGMLEEKKLKQCYASKEWMAGMASPGFNPPGGFSGDGNIWFLINKTEEAQ